MFAVAACSRSPAPAAEEPVGVSTVHAADMPPPSTSAAAETGGATTCLSDAGPILFEEGSSTVTPEIDAALQRVARCLTRGPLAGAAVVAVGHADVVGQEASNVVLGLDRAAKVRDFLVAHGVDARRVVAVSSGDRETRATVPGRRVDVVVVTPPSAAR